MSGFLLDTHTLLWAAHDTGNLSEKVQQLLRTKQSRFYVSAASAWEIATKVRLGKLDDESDIHRDFEVRIQNAGYTALPVSCSHGLAAGKFVAPHKDPFDRMIAAQALLENLTLLSKDSALDVFGVKRVW